MRACSCDFSPRLYRGQNRRYERTVASLFRLSTEIDWLVASIRLVEFAEHVFHHPGTQAIHQMEILGLKGWVDLLGQGQHYGIPTQYLDVTWNRDVAEFFARCRPTVNSDPTEPWEVLPQAEYDAVLYTVDVKTLVNSSDSEIVVPMGPSPLLAAVPPGSCGIAHQRYGSRFHPGGDGRIPAIFPRPMPSAKRDDSPEGLCRFVRSANVYPVRDIGSQKAGGVLTTMTQLACRKSGARWHQTTCPVSSGGGRRQVILRDR